MSSGCVTVEVPVCVISSGGNLKDHLRLAVRASHRTIQRKRWTTDPRAENIEKKIRVREYTNSCMVLGILEI